VGSLRFAHPANRRRHCGRSEAIHLSASVLLIALPRAQ
jgi:hypothetical protein